MGRYLDRSLYVAGLSWAAFAMLLPSICTHDSPIDIPAEPDLFWDMSLHPDLFSDVLFETWFEIATKKGKMKDVFLAAGANKFSENSNVKITKACC